MKIQLRKPFFPLESIKTIKTEIEKTLESGNLTLGINVQNFESKFSKYHQTKYACAVSSATAGLHLSILALGIKNGDEVIVPAKTFISTANAAVYCNAKPIFCDVEDDTFQIDPTKIKKLITKKTKAIIPVHLGGNICSMKEILDIANEHNISVIEDASHAHGATMNGKKAGSFGDLGVFSFYPDKVMASSDGGIVITNNRLLYEKIIPLRNVGRPYIGKYDFSVIGYNYRMNEIQAIIANEQLRLLPKMLKRRREIAGIYNEVFKTIQNLKSQKILPKVNASYYAYVLKLTKGNLNQLRKKLLSEGIETSPMFKTIYKMKPYIEFSKIKQKCTVSEKLDEQTFTIPLHVGLTKNQINFVGEKIKQHIT